MPRNITVIFADGTKHVYKNAPDDVTPEQTTQRAQKQFGKTVASLDGGKKTAPASKPKDGSVVGGLVLGALKPFDNVTSLASNIPVFGSAVDYASEAMGMPTTRQAVAENNAARKNNTRTGYQTLGNIAGTLPVAALPIGAFGQGVVSGALLTDRKNIEGVVTDALIGGVGGKVGQKIGQAVGYAANPVVSAASRTLYNAGIPQTLGQIAQSGRSATARAISNTEQAFQSVLGLGDMISSARFLGTEKLNSAIANRALSNIRSHVPKWVEPGHEMVAEVGKQLGVAYDRLVPNLVAKFDINAAEGFTKARNLAREVSRGEQLEKVINRVFGGRIGDRPIEGAILSGQKLKDAESELTALYKKYRNTQGDDSIYGDAINQVRQTLRGMVMASNPAHAKELQAINKGWAQLATYRRAATAPGNATGIVTPSQMLSATRASGFNDPLINAAKQILPNTLPDSGTARRGATTLGALALGGGTAGAAINPAFLAAPAVGMLYTKPGMTALNSFVFKPRAKVLRGAGDAARYLADYAPQAVPAYLQNRR